MRDNMTVEDAIKGHRLENGEDGGGRRVFLSGRGVHAGETLYLLTVLRLARRQVRVEHPARPSRACTARCQAYGEEVVFWVPREARTRGLRNCGRWRAR